VTRQPGDRQPGDRIPGDRSRGTASRGPGSKNPPAGQRRLTMAGMSACYVPGTGPDVIV